jgi:hypothetical protein
MNTSNNISAPVTKKSNRKKYAWMLLVIGITLVGFYLLIFNFMIPKTAPLAMPYKWRMIPLRQSKEIVHGYFGAPDSSRGSANKDVWVGGTKDKTYILNIYYIYDSVPSAYSIYYKYHSWFSSREYLIDSNSIK